jgi:hypothetical protein
MGRLPCGLAAVIFSAVFSWRMSPCREQSLSAMEAVQAPRSFPLAPSLPADFSPALAAGLAAAACSLMRKSLLERQIGFLLSA